MSDRVSPRVQLFPSPSKPTDLGDSPKPITSRKGTIRPPPPTVANVVDESPVPKKPRVDAAVASVMNAATVAKAPAVAMPPPTAARVAFPKPSNIVETGVSSPSQTPRSSDLSSQVPLTFETPTATQLFAPDEPLTATQEAYVVDGYKMPSPPPFFVEETTSDSPVTATQRIEKEKRLTAQWAEKTRAFFDFIDQRRLAVEE